MGEGRSKSRNGWFCLPSPLPDPETQSKDFQAQKWAQGQGVGDGVSVICQLPGAQAVREAPPSLTTSNCQRNARKWPIDLCSNGAANEPTWGSGGKWETSLPFAAAAIASAGRLWTERRVFDLHKESKGFEKRALSLLHRCKGSKLFLKTFNLHVGYHYFKHIH